MLKKCVITKRIKTISCKRWFLQCEFDENLFYIYEKGEYSFYRYKYIKHVGSSRSSKSWSLEELAIRECEENNNFRFTVWRDSQASLGETVWKDFRKVFPLSGRQYKFTRDTRSIYFPNGSTIEPHGDDTTNAHGLTQDKAWLNEPYRMSKDTFDQIDQRSEQIWLDINPTGTHWSDKLEENPRCKVIHSTFQDNPFCPIEMKLKILSYNPDNPVNVKNNTADAYKWSVYGLGMKAEKPNRIFNWKEISNLEYNEIKAPIYIGNDWGKVDPWAIAEVKYRDGCLYVHELNYKSENKIRIELSQKENDIVKGLDNTEDEDSMDEGLVKWYFDRLGISKKSTIICDSNRPRKIAALRRIGYDYAEPASKPGGSIIDGIDLLLNLKVYYTSSSANTAYEQENYSRKVDRYGTVLEEPEDKENHICDAVRMVALYLQRIGVINLV